MAANSETARRSSEVYRAAKLALLRVQIHQTLDRTDASAREVEEALARLVEDVRGDVRFR